MHVEWNLGPPQTMTKPADSCWGRTVAGCSAVIFRLAVLLALALGVPSARELIAQQTKEPNASEKAAPHTIDPAKEASIRKLLELTGAKQHAIDFGMEVGEQMRDVLRKGYLENERLQQVGDALVSKLAARLNSDDFIAQLIPIYDKAFSAEDIEKINEFYQSPAGRKLLEVSPDLLEDTSNASEQWVKKQIPQIMEQVEDQFPELKQGAR